MQFELWEMLWRHGAQKLQLCKDANITSGPPIDVYIPLNELFETLFKKGEKGFTRTEVTEPIEWFYLKYLD